MNQSIHFPNLGIHLQDVGKSVSVFGIEIAYYGIIIGIAILVGFLITLVEAKRTRQKTEVYLDLAIYGIIAGLLGARLYYVIFSWDYYKKHFFSIFNLRQGGMAIYGAIIAAVIVVIVYAGKHSLSAARILDTASLGLVTGQMIGRWGNFFNREAFGEYTKGLFAMQLPVDAVRIADITDKMRTHIIKVGDVSYIQVHPTFLYESVWCLIVLVILFQYRRKKEFQGELFLVYLGLYSFGRFFIEGLRSDQLKMLLTGIPVSQLIAGIFAVFSLFIVVWGRKVEKRRRKRKHKRVHEAEQHR